MHPDLVAEADDDGEERDARAVLEQGEHERKWLATVAEIRPLCRCLRLRLPTARFLPHFRASVEGDWLCHPPPIRHLLTLRIWEGGTIVSLENRVPSKCASVEG